METIFFHYARLSTLDHRLLFTSMTELLTNPSFQSGVLPFTVALLVGSVLHTRGWRWAGLGFAVAYLASSYLTTGFQFFPLTNTRKILMLGGGAVVLGLLLDWYPLSRRAIPWLLALLGAVAATWLIWPVVKRLDGSAFWIMSAATILYSAWLTAWFEGLRHHSMQAATAALSLGIGTGVSAILGASALLGQLGGTIGAAAGAYVLLLLFFKNLSLGSSFTLPVAVLGASVGIAGVVYANLAWYSLVPLAIIPLMARIPIKQEWNNALKILILCAFTVPLAVAAIAITWQATETSVTSFY